MATERLSMQKVREILRQKLELELKRTHRQVGEALKVSYGGVGSLMVRWKASGLAWDDVKDMPEAALEQRLYGPRLPATAARNHSSARRHALAPSTPRSRTR